MPQRHREAYPPEFKAKLIALVLAGRSPEELADASHYLSARRDGDLDENAIDDAFSVAGYDRRLPHPKVAVSLAPLAL